jgi:hypothetical protein
MRQVTPSRCPAADFIAFLCVYDYEFCIRAEVGKGEEGDTIAVGQLTQTGWIDQMAVPIR